MSSAICGQAAHAAALVYEADGDCECHRRERAVLQPSSSSADHLDLLSGVCGMARRLGGSAKPSTASSTRS